MLDRSQPPPVVQPSRLRLPHPRTYTLRNGIPVYAISMGTQEIVKVELVFYAGRPYESAPLVARATASLLKEGTIPYEAAAIAERLDFYGGTLNASTNMDTASVILYSLNKHLEPLLDVLAAVLTQPTFPEKELTTFVDRNKQRLQVDLERSDVVAYREVTDRIFGATHPYGYNSTEAAYDALTREQLVAHYRRCYTAGNCQIIVSGRLRGDMRELLDRYCGAIPAGERLQVTLDRQSPAPGRVRIASKEAVQSAIRLGCRLDLSEEERYQMLVLDVILGGYFGSRLMANVREDKGYTYNIFSSYERLLQGAFFYIGTEVGKEVEQLALREIHREMARLREELIDEEELAMVRNYMLGTFLTALDGPFNISEIVRGLVIEGRSFDQPERMIRAVKTVDARTLRALARRVLLPEQMWTVIVG